MRGLRSLRGLATSACRKVLSWRSPPSGRTMRNETPVGIGARQNQSAARPPPTKYPKGEPNPPPRLSASQACSYLAALLRVR